MNNVWKGSSWSLGYIEDHRHFFSRLWSKYSVIALRYASTLYILPDSRSPGNSLFKKKKSQIQFTWNIAEKGSSVSC
uniref:Ovule protein n=1 Tax=Caenorhabditis tropicalis TaxID=1561998 RepID=A0A1I7TPB8_9PELO